ncbi:hypothetical protein M0R45_017927 [Rubus argutus]|uniref:Bromo domain-containing protein n=1 Tax=Rubus argutus TaxID=59490 RepID=A0AAW1XYI0_RUBAR
MAREHETSAQPWGTLEELLLVSAVNRHGPRAGTPSRWRSSPGALRRSSLLRTARTSSMTSNGGFESRSSERGQPSRRFDRVVGAEGEEVGGRQRPELEGGTRRRARPRISNVGEESNRFCRRKLAGKSNSGEDFVSDSSERENRSFNESNSTSQRSEVKANGVEEKKALEEQGPDPKRNESDPVRTEIRSELERDCSANGKVIDDDNEDNENNNKKKAGVEEAGRPGESNELSGSNSDVQSSASLSKKRKRRRKVAIVAAAKSPRVRKTLPPPRSGVKLVKLEPLVKVLTIIRAHRLGSVFERRLRSQESQRYKNLIRQHVDLHVVQSKLDKGVYKNCTHNFFRDLLLLFNNAVVFFRKTTPEHVAALELRSLVLKELNERLPKPQPVQVSSSLCAVNVGSINALSEGGNNNKKGGVRKERVEVEEKEAKVKVNEKKVDDIPLVKTEDKGVRKRRTRERRGGRRSRTTTSNSKNVESKTKIEHGGNELSSHDGLEVVKMEKKEEVKKRQGAASFLRRMKQNGRGGVGRANNSSDVFGGRDEGEEGQESGGRAKRGVGRPPKRLETVAAGSGKRGKDNGEADQVGSAGRPRKRTRR